jgi:hypothetical protein
MRGGSTLVTARNILFHNSIAYNAETGEKSWAVDLNQDNVAPITYILDGKQYIAVLARSAPKNRLFVFALDGKEPIPPITTRP